MFIIRKGTTVICVVVFVVFHLCTVCQGCIGQGNNGAEETDSLVEATQKPGLEPLTDPPRLDQWGCSRFTTAKGQVVRYFPGWKPEIPPGGYAIFDCLGPTRELSDHWARNVSCGEDLEWHPTPPTCIEMEGCSDVLLSAWMNYDGPMPHLRYDETDEDDRHPGGSSVTISCPNQGDLLEINPSKYARRGFCCSDGQSKAFCDEKTGRWVVSYDGSDGDLLEIKTNKYARRGFCCSDGQFEAFCDKDTRHWMVSYDGSEKPGHHPTVAALAKISCDRTFCDEIGGTTGELYYLENCLQSLGFPPPEVEEEEEKTREGGPLDYEEGELEYFAKSKEQQGGLEEEYFAETNGNIPEKTGSVPNGREYYYDVA